MMFKVNNFAPSAPAKAILIKTHAGKAHKKTWSQSSARSTTEVFELTRQ